MGFLDSVSKFTSGVAEKTKGNVDVFSLNQQISNTEKEINDLFKQLGTNYYEIHKDDAESDLSGFVAYITENYAKIEQLKAEVEQKKAEIAAVQLTTQNVQPQQEAAPVQMQATGRICPKCGNPAGDDLFCGYCGAKQELDTADEAASQQNDAVGTEEESQEMPQINKKFCKECGSELDDDAMFCSTCGTKVE
ncbi:zinc-ribbon domain-containing protein [Butyrivibrio sp. VCB2006]|uniref:zinc-ribbon domain-containing protein n=1 Tax=Butyrivibrio sp. VCB2006 TaxID=1280679 RepID=UPI0004294C4D|nr:zinc-ribbon domain-containing protein [Butyrivibrio sp. VCB2006]